MSFLRRLMSSARQNGAESEPEPEPESEIDSIVRNLNQVFNTKKGYGSVIRDLGLGDYEATWNTTELVNTLSDEIRTAVCTYEPRFEDPRVALVARDPKLWIRFTLSGTVAGTPWTLYVDMDTKYRKVVVFNPESSS